MVNLTFLLINWTNSDTLKVPKTSPLTVSITSLLNSTRCSLIPFNSSLSFVAVYCLLSVIKTSSTETPFNLICPCLFLDPQKSRFSYQVNISKSRSKELILSEGLSSLKLTCKFYISRLFYSHRSCKVFRADYRQTDWSKRQTFSPLTNIIRFN